MLKNKNQMTSMTKYYKTALLLIVILVQLTCSFAQGPQVSNITIREKFLNYCKEVPREEIYLQTDREEYISGEDIWFNIFLIDRQSNKLSSESDLVYFELLNPDNMPIIRKRIKIENGSGPGQIILPDSLSSGKYTIRAYTNWMKNFLPFNCFMQKVNIYNALSAKNFVEKPITGNVNSVSHLKNNGVLLGVKKTGTETLDISINSSAGFRSVNSNLCYIIIQTHGVLNYDGAVTIRDSETKVTLPESQLIPGINQIVIFDSKGNPVAEKFIFTPRKNDFNINLNIPETAKTRSKVDADLLIDNLSGKNAKLSVSVVPEPEYRYVQELADYMVFGSEFGIIPDELRKTSLNEVPEQIMESFLSGVGSNWIDWDHILNGTLPPLKYNMEKEEHYIYGKLVEKTTQLPQPGENIFMSSPSKIASFQYAVSDSTGSFYFKVPISDVSKDIIIQPEVVDKNYSVKMESSFSEEYLSTGKRNDSVNKPLPAYIPKLSTNYQVSRIFGISYLGDPVKTPVVQKEHVKFYGNPDIGLKLDDYIKLPVMQEVFFELLPGVFLKNKKAAYEISLLDPVEKRVYNTAPLLLVDGVVVHDAAVIAAIDPDLAERIDVVKDKYFVGDYMFFGLVNVITRAGNFSTVTLPDYAIRMQYKVYEPTNNYISPEYSKSMATEDRIPDFRNTLYWNPSLDANKEGKAEFGFWTSDFKTKYILKIEGISEDGKPVSLTRHIIVN